MGQWDEYYNTDFENEPEETVTPEEENTTVMEDGTIELTESLFNDFINRLSGINPETGYAKAEIAYQAYDYNAPETDPDKARVYTISNAAIYVARNKRFPQVFTVDIVFKSSEDTELKLLWGRMQKHMRNQTETSDHTWILYFNILERASVSNQTETTDSLLTMNIYNPILYYITREVPNQRVSETIVDGELLGGNIIRMLVPAELLTFSINDDMDTNEIKGEVQRDLEQSRFLNASEEE